MAVVANHHTGCNCSFLGEGSVDIDFAVAEEDNKGHLWLAIVGARRKIRRRRGLEKGRSLLGLDSWIGGRRCACQVERMQRKDPGGR